MIHTNNHASIHHHHHLHFYIRFPSEPGLARSRWFFPPLVPEEKLSTNGVKTLKKTQSTDPSQ